MPQAVIGGIGLAIAAASAVTQGVISAKAASSQSKAQNAQLDLAKKAAAKQDAMRRGQISADRQAEDQAARAAQAAAIRSRFGSLNTKGGTIATSLGGALGPVQTTGKTLLGL